MVKTNELTLSFQVEVTAQNKHLVKKLAESDVIPTNPEEIEEGDTIDIDYVLEGEFSEYALPMVLLFNSSLSRPPKLRVTRG